jgi:hypothetical protein
MQYQNPLNFQGPCLKDQHFPNAIIGAIWSCWWQLQLTIGSCPSHSFMTLVILGLERLQDPACLCNAVYRTTFMESTLLMFGTRWTLFYVRKCNQIVRQLTTLWIAFAHHCDTSDTLPFNRRTSNQTVLGRAANDFMPAVISCNR